jgi:pleckstrin homology domain-containing family A member 1/2
MHRRIPLSQILDAFEYDVPPATAPPSHTRGGSDEVDHTLLKHTFKIVTTKRTLVLCAPSEEEEIQWLSAVRALIARRSDAGVVPGDVQGTSALRSSGIDQQGHGQMMTAGSGSGGGMKNRREAPQRKISISGSGAGGFSPGTAPIAEESVS